MKSVKKFLSLVLSLLMVISFVNLPAKAETNSPLDVASMVKSSLAKADDTDYQRAIQQRMASQYGVAVLENAKFEGQVPEISDNDQVRVIVKLSTPSTYEMAKAQKVPYSQASKFESKVEAAQRPVIEKAKEIGVIRHTYKNLYNGFSAIVNYGDIAQLKAISGVESVKVANMYFIENNNAVDITKASKVWAEYGLKGEGTVVAIVDSGIDPSHKDMKLTDPTKAKLTKEKVEAKIAQNNLNSIPDNGMWYSDKVPYGFNFADMNNNIVDTNPDVGMHGMHVGGIVAANGEVKGVAPEAQLLAMKVFSNNPGFGSAYNDDIAAAIEMSVLHGADVINMSLGSTAGFIDPNDSEQIAIKNATDAGVIAVVSAGNSYYSSEGVYNPYRMDPDMSVVGSPGLFGDTLQVASSENSKIVTTALSFGTEKMAYSSAGPANPVDEFAGKEVEYVFCNLGLIGINNGTPVDDFAGVDVKGKIALIQRGGYTTIPGNFVDKITNAYNKGAIGVIIFNSQAGGNALMNMAYPTNLSIPAVFVGLDDGTKLKNAVSPSNKVAFLGDTTVIANPSAYRMSDFSSWGTAPGLEFKPDVTAPGGNIYSTVNNDKYEVMSGTSMAAPHTSGAVAVLVQQLRKSGVTLTDRSFVNLAKNIITSTSEPVLDPGSGNLPYLTRKQGAGLIQLDRAVTSKAYVTDGNGNATVALKEIGNSKTFPIQVKNYGTAPLTFTLQNKYGVLTNAGSATFIKPTTSTFANATIAFDKAEITVEPGQSATVNVTLTIPSTALMNTFAEGFIYLTEKNAKNPNLVIPFMGFYGQWDGQTGPRMFDAPAWDSANIYYNGTTLLGLSYDDYEEEYINYYLGFEGLDEYDLPIIDEDHIAFSPNGDDNLDSLVAKFNLLRNAREFEIKVLDSAKNVVRNISREEYLRKAYTYAGGAVDRSQPKYKEAWDGTIYNPISGSYEVAPEGQYYIRIQAKPDIANAEWYILDMPVKLDTTRPMVKAKGEKKDANIYEITLNEVSDGNGVGVQEYQAVIYMGDPFKPMPTMAMPKPIFVPLNFVNGKATLEVPDSFFQLGLVAIDYAGNAGVYPLEMFSDNDGIIFETHDYFFTKGEVTLDYRLGTLVQPMVDHITLSINDGPELNNEKNLSYTFKNLVDKNYIVTIRLYSADNRVITQDYYDFIVDTKGPEITFPKVEGTDVYLVKGEKEYLLEYKVTDPNKVYQVSVNEQVNSFISKDGNYKYVVDLSEGDRVMTIKAEDFAGNISTKVINIHTTIENPIIKGEITTDGRYVDGVYIISGKTLNIKGNLIFKDDAPVNSLTINGQPIKIGEFGDFDTDVTYDAFGLKELSIKAEVIKEGQTTTPSTLRNLKIMCSPATFTQNEYITNSSEQKIEYAVTTDSALNKLTVSVDGQPGVEQPLTSTEFTAKDLAEGNHMVNFVFYDAAGAVVAYDYISVIVDKTLPVAVDIIDADKSKVSEGNVYTNEVINITAVPSERLLDFSINGQALVWNEDSSTYTGAITLPKEGLNRLTVSMTDLAGNKNEYQFKAWLDKSAPVVEIVQPTTDIVDTAAATYQLKLKISDNTFGYNLYINGEQVANAEEGMGLGTPVKDVTYDYKVPAGKSYIDILAVDGAGNKYMKKITVNNTANTVPSKAIVNTTSYNADLKALSDITINVAFNNDQLMNIDFYNFQEDKYNVSSGTLVYGVDYTVSADKIVISKNVLSRLGVGEKELTLKFKSGFECYVAIYVEDTRDPSTSVESVLVNGTKVQGFDFNVYNYLVEVSPFAQTMPMVSYILPADSKATVKIVQASKAGDTATITITSENQTVKIYKVKFVVPLAIEKLSTETSYAKGSQAVIRFKATNATNVNKNATLIVGVYDSENKLVSIMTGGYLVKVGESVEMSATLTTPNLTGYKIRCFVWDSMQGMNALSQVVELPIN